MTKASDSPMDGSPARSDDPEGYLGSSYYIDFEHPIVRTFVSDHVDTNATSTRQAVRLFYAVRDQIRYNPYSARLAPGAYRASATLTARESWCVPKAILMTAGARLLGIPARPGYADVRNHLTTENLQALIGTDVFAYHGYVELWLEGRWVKVTPVFNVELCQKFGVRPQEFDGTADVLFQEFDAGGRRHMEYLQDRGPYTDLPLGEILTDFRERYPRWIAHIEAGAEGDMHVEAGRQP
ncbi:MAG: transglutaminase family protein [Pseudomonadota bacterium]